MKFILHQYHVMNGHTGRWFQYRDEAMKAAFAVIRKQCSQWMKANKNNPQSQVLEDCRMIRRHLKKLEYQEAFDAYNEAFGHELTLALTIDCDNSHPISLV